MPIALSFAFLACTLVAAILLRSRWPQLSVAHRRWLQGTATLLLVPSVATFLTKWDITNRRIADLELCLRLVACQFGIVFFTLLRPRVLTIGVAAILLPFFFATSVVGPLSSLFQTDAVRVVPIADGYVLESVPWHGVEGNSGVDYDLSYRPQHLLGVRRGITGTRFYDTQCNTALTYAVLRPATHVLDVYCPPLASATPETALSGRHDHYLIPRGALSPSLRQETAK